MKKGVEYFLCRYRWGIKMALLVLLALSLSIALMSASGQYVRPAAAVAALAIGCVLNVVHRY